ncbi:MULTISPECIES: methionine ABC transporter ATP-binding protein [unclassified Granulicatella]|uniref:methionine ABC transporter ATP-binding protein n=1 Tax=unclassified Granulicatella TaxID=2630493 RepID=UPI00107499C4|nr:MULTISPECIES: ATP-binding cassette domain-containing protein [unclassified Granulicatella]MBF0781030.1 ATP-binding cassette domain-containing protein [Granulicatella sp. 19428wC4_WM01]TFU92570.1 ATP-binding cassette domain-containing protein [Granulicatella sp. WM01]
MINIQRLNVSFKQKKNNIHAVKDVSLTINEGEIFGIIGYSGAGKSTLLRCINLLEKPTSGTVLVDRVDLTALSKTELRQKRSGIGMIFQQFNLIHAKTVYENIAFNLLAAGVPQSEHRKRIEELLELVGLQDKQNSYPEELSGGQKQRVGIARALANNPKILLCDEATSALDPDTTQQILELLKNINQLLNITIVLVTHEMEVIKSICQRVAVMEKGEIVEVDDVYQLFAKPKSSLMKQFVASLYQDNLPQLILKAYQNDTLVRLVFDNSNAEQAIIDHLKEAFQVSVSIVQGKIEYIQQKPLGHLTIALKGHHHEIEKVCDYLKRTITRMEVIHSYENIH